MGSKFKSLSSNLFIFQRNGGDAPVGKKGRYLDFIDMLLEAKVCYNRCHISLTGRNICDLDQKSWSILVTTLASEAVEHF